MLWLSPGHPASSGPVPVHPPREGSLISGPDLREPQPEPERKDRVEPHGDALVPSQPVPQLGSGRVERGHAEDDTHDTVRAALAQHELAGRERYARATRLQGHTLPPPEERSVGLD